MQLTYCHFYLKVSYRMLEREDLTVTCDNLWHLVHIFTWKTYLLTSSAVESIVERNYLFFTLVCWYSEKAASSSLNIIWLSHLSKWKKSCHRQANTYCFHIHIARFSVYILTWIAIALQSETIKQHTLLVLNSHIPRTC